MTGFRIKQTVLMVLGWIHGMINLAGIPPHARGPGTLLLFSMFGLASGYVVALLTGGRDDPPDGRRTGYRIKQAALMAIGFAAAIPIYLAYNPPPLADWRGLRTGVALGAAAGCLLARMTGGESD